MKTQIAKALPEWLYYDCDQIRGKANFIYLFKLKKKKKKAKPKKKQQKKKKHENTIVVASTHT